MSTTATELFSTKLSRDRTGKITVERQYKITSADPDVAIEYGPAIGAQYKRYYCFVCSKNVEPLSKDLSMLTVRYETPDRNSEVSRNKTTWTYDVAGETERVMAVEDSAYIAHYAPAAEGPEGTDELANTVGACIELHPGERLPRGTDKITPRITMSCELAKRPNEVNSTYKAAIYGLVGKVNDATFKGWEAGEVLFAGCQITEVSGEMTRLNFRFLCQKNRDAWTVDMINMDGTGYTGVSIADGKKGWEYFWTRTSRVLSEGTADKPVAAGCGIISAHVHQIYEEASFSPLGINDLPALYSSFFQ